MEECRRAVDEFRAHHGIDDPLERVDWTCVRWRRSADTPIEPAGPQRAGAAGPARAVVHDQDARIVSMHERAVMRDKRHLERDLAELRARLAAAETEVAALRASPLRGPRAWLRDRLGR